MTMESQPILRKITGNRSEVPCFHIEDTNIDTVQSAKYLGVILDKYLVWDKHITLLQIKISRSLSFLKSAKEFLPLKIPVLSIKGVVEAHFRYCCSVWGNCTKLQHRAARLVINSSYDFRFPTAKLKWPSNDEIIKGETTNMVYK